MLAPADNAARRSFNALIDRRPAAIARCIGAGDVATAFEFAGAEDLEVAVRGGGHNPADGVREHAFIGQQHLFNPPYGEDRNYWKGHFVRELPDELLDELLRRMLALGRPPGQVLIESLHGGPKDADPSTAALGFRNAAFNVSAMASWQDPTLDEPYIEWARETAAALEPWSVSGGYVNYMQADEPVERVRAAFAEQSFERLQALKSRYDPDNVLRRNQNIPPTPVPAAHD